MTYSSTRNDTIVDMEAGCEGKDRFSRQSMFRHDSLMDVLPPRHSLMASVGDIDFDMSMVSLNDSQGSIHFDDENIHQNNSEDDKINEAIHAMGLSQIDSMLEDAEQPSQPTKPDIRRVSVDAHNIQPRKPLDNVLNRQAYYAKEQLMIIKENQSSLFWTLLSVVLAILGLAAVAFGIFR